jgi:flagellar hook-associated protein 3 FlgL
MTTSFSRLGTANTYDNALRNLTGRQTSLSNLQENLTSGKKVVRASDDPTGAAQAERAQTRLARVVSDQRALEAQRNAIAMAESTLGDVSDAIANFRELIVSAGNGSHTAAERETIAVQLTGLRDQVLALANRKDTNGLPLFSALGSALEPFVGPTPGYTYQGLPGQSASSEVSIPFTLDGDSAFMHQPTRDKVFNVGVSNTTSPDKAIPTSRALVTSNVSVTDEDAVASTAKLAKAEGSSDYPEYKVAFSNWTGTEDPVTKVTSYTVDYSITETPPLVRTPAVTFGTTTSAAFKRGETVKIPIVGIPGLAISVTGTPPLTDKDPTKTFIGSPANGDVITIKPRNSVFSVLDTAIEDIGKAKNSNAANQAISQALNNIDIGLERLSAVRGQAGDLLNRADRITANQEKRSIQLEGDRSRAEDLDMIKGVADFQNQQTGYQAALQSYAQVQKLSLFNFIS